MSAYVALVSLASGQKVVVDTNGVVRTLLEGELPKPGEVILDRGQELGHESTLNVELIGEDGVPQGISDDVEEIFAALEQGQDPTQLGEDFAAAAGQQVSSSATLAGTIVRNGEETIASTEFSTEGLLALGLSETQSVSLIAQYPLLQENVVAVETNSNPDGLDLSLTTLEDQPITGKLTASDTDGDNVTFSEGNPPSNGLLAVDENGNWTYTPNPNFNGEDSFTVIVSDGNGGTDTIVVNVGVTPVDDDSDITIDSDAGNRDTGSVTEDVAVTGGNLTTTGTVTLNDADGDGAFGTPVFDAANSTVTEELGSLSIDENGEWTYTVNNDAVQYLDANESETVTYTIPTADGADTQTITITIHGANDGAKITGDDSGSVTEDAAETTATGTLLASDVDNTDNVFQAQADAAGQYGTFRVDANGKWTYVLDNGNETVDALNVDETLTETFTVKSEDGTEQVVTITIHGANDGAKITGDDSGSVTEDAAETTATGTLLASDVDNTDNVFQAQADAAASTARSVWMRTASGPTCWITATRRSMR
ncbi:VCBS domain-containing protein [Vibrio japonicus]|uniref:VCBS domain-containing protein n=1 Tax=Vibrio japonicus TaxID=1824638 RepID=A0ABY5LBN4_9VIBR|nr:VCBS domain-containing protein [Vibrio japonicus]UUM29458.1 VCBS domain-containing protein [Vibrio japonicus]